MVTLNLYSSPVSPISPYNHYPSGFNSESPMGTANQALAVYGFCRTFERTSLLMTIPSGQRSYG